MSDRITELERDIAALRKTARELIYGDGTEDFGGGLLGNGHNITANCRLVGTHHTDPNCKTEQWMDQAIGWSRLAHQKIVEFADAHLSVSAPAPEPSCDAELLDWLEANPAASEPATYWCQIHGAWRWRYMGRSFATLREAVRAALEANYE
jgi:hypothetical protein